MSSKGHTWKNSAETIQRKKEAWIRRKNSPLYLEYLNKMKEYGLKNIKFLNPTAPKTLEHRKNISKALMGKSKSPQHILRMKEVGKGRITAELRKKMILGTIGIKRGSPSESTKNKMRLARLGKRDSEETKLKKHQAAFKRPRNSFKNTAIELMIAAKLKEQNIKFIQQEPLNNITIADFYLPDSNSVILCDGCFWHACLKCHPNSQRLYCIEKDKLITDKLKAKGYKVFRFWEHDIKNNINECVRKILNNEYF